jgi:putative N6-adenine-specific DNA methylase
MWNGPIECRLFRFDMVKGSLKRTPNDATQNPLGTSEGPDAPGAPAA